MSHLIFFSLLLLMNRREIWYLGGKVMKKYDKGRQNERHLPQKQYLNSVCISFQFKIYFFHFLSIKFGISYFLELFA